MISHAGCDRINGKGRGCGFYRGKIPERIEEICGESKGSHCLDSDLVPPE
jgi:hypothetical protein